MDSNENVMNKKSLDVYGVHLIEDGYVYIVRRVTEAELKKDFIWTEEDWIDE